MHSHADQRASQDPGNLSAAFYGSDTFDPAYRPGMRRTTTNGGEVGTWGGYVYAGDFAVHASDTDRDLVREVLDSAQ